MLSPDVYSSSVKGSVAKRVECEKCGREYAYWMKREGVGKVFSFQGSYSYHKQEEAENLARDELDRMLRREADLVPCPHCGWYQDEMIEFVRKTKYKTFVIIAWVAAGVCLFLSPILKIFLGVFLRLFFKVEMNDTGSLISGFIMFVIVFMFIALAGALTYFRPKLAMWHNPNENESEEDRIERGRSWAMSQKQFDKLFGQKKFATRKRSPADQYVKGKGHVNDLEYESDQQNKPRKNKHDDDEYTLKEE